MMFGLDGPDKRLESDAKGSKYHAPGIRLIGARAAKLVRYGPKTK
jgi:hypothetical protein